MERVHGKKYGLGNTGGDLGHNYYSHDGNAGNGAEGGKRSMFLEFANY
jgi:hypothetical protein